MKSARAVGMVALMIAILATGVVVCPCAEQPPARDHGCCARGTALRAAGSDCCAGNAALGVAASVERAPALLLADIVAPLPASVPALQYAHPRVPFLAPASPPTILRI